eukprot:10710894-Ditylum_brightwellii.AAC.1
MLNNEARSYTGGHFSLSKHTNDPTTTTTDKVPLNSPTHTICKEMRNVMVSSAEAEIGAMHTNAQKGEDLQLVLEEMGHKQPPTST